VPFLALAAALTAGEDRLQLGTSLVPVLGGVLAIIAVLAAGRWLLRPLFHIIAHSRLRELFTLTVLLVVLSSAWVSHSAGLSFALGAFLAGMMLAETEYRHQIESVIRPFRDILLGLFFISVGMLLDLRLLGSARQLATVLLTLATLVVLKATLAALVTRPFTNSRFKALRTGIVMSIGGEFGIALCTILLETGLLPQRVGGPLLIAIVLSMLLSPLILNNNKRLARFVLKEQAPLRTASEREEAATHEIAEREHVILCGFGRVGQNVARVLESQGFEYIALDLDPARIRAARQLGDPVIYGDSADEELLAKAGIAAASAVVISFSDPATSIGILRSVRQIRPEVPVLVRTQDDARIKELQDAGEPDAGIARADAAARAGVTRGAHARGHPQQPLRGAAQHRAPRRRPPGGRDERAPRGNKVGGAAAGRVVGGTHAGGGAQPRRRGRLYRRAPPRHSRARTRRGYRAARRGHRRHLRAARGPGARRSGAARRMTAWRS
jgi:CPA2 family monovalent cation:H+ antiporter-2